MNTDSDYVDFESGYDWVDDISEMHAYYKVHQAVEKFDDTKLAALRRFRENFLQEELDEAKEATDPADFIDAMIDLCVVAIGTLDIYGVDSQEAWHRVHLANMAKNVGIKEGRPNPLGLPDLIKPEGWVAPNHDDLVPTRLRRAFNVPLDV
jgi:predicted HAD superfamily Cof-like phosphohydrolase